MSEPIMVKDLGPTAQVLIYPYENPLPPDSDEEFATTMVALNGRCPKLSSLWYDGYSTRPKDGEEYDGVLCAVHVMDHDGRFELIADVACAQHGTVRTEGGDAVAFIDREYMEEQGMSREQALARITADVKGPWTAWVNNRVWRMEVLEIGSDYEPALGPLLDMDEDECAVYDIAPPALDARLSAILGEDGTRMIGENPWVFSKLVPEDYDGRPEPAARSAGASDGDDYGLPPVSDNPLGDAFLGLSWFFHRMIETEGFNDGDLSVLSPALEAIVGAGDANAGALEAVANHLRDCGDSQSADDVQNAAQGLHQGARHLSAVLGWVREAEAAT